MRIGSLFEKQFPSIAAIFKQFLEKKIDNLDMKDLLLHLFNNLDHSAWESRRAVMTTDNFFDYIMTSLSVRSESEDLLFDWNFVLQWKCTKEECGQIHSVGNLQRNNDMCIIGDISIPLQDKIDQFFIESTRLIKKEVCEFNNCNRKLKPVKATITYPTILRIQFDSKKIDRRSRLVVPVDLEFDGQDYVLICTIYGNGGNFKTRYIRNGEFFEADGYRAKNGRYEAASVPLEYSTAEAFPYAISATDYAINDMFYLRKIDIDVV
jgi:hypothetical protein